MTGRPRLGWKGRCECKMREGFQATGLAGVAGARVAGPRPPLLLERLARRTCARDQIQTHEGGRPTMPLVPVKFRCYQCNQLLGASRSRVGAVIACPKCSAELVVPEPTEPAASVLDAGSSELLPSIASGLAQGFLALRPEDIRVEPGVLLERPPRVPPPEPVATEPPPSPKLPPPEPEPPAPAKAAEAPPPLSLPPIEPSAPAPEPVVPLIQCDAPKVVERTPPPRPRDIVLPRSVVAAWSLFVLLAQCWRSWRGCSRGITSGGSIAEVRPELFGEHRRRVDEVEGRVGIDEPAVQPVDPEPGEREVPGAPGDQVGVVVGPVERRALWVLPMAEHATGPTAEVEDRAEGFQDDPVLREDQAEARGRRAPPSRNHEMSSDAPTRCISRGGGSGSPLPR